MARIVVTGRIPDPGISVLQAAGHEVMVWGEPGPMPRDVLLAEAANADAMVTLLTERIDDELLDVAGRRLRAVCNVAVGYNNIDVEACRRRGVVVTNTPGVLTDATADIALALMLMVTRRLAEGERLIRSGEPWKWSMFMMLGTGVQGRRLGIVGMGQIGTAMARRARVLGMSVAYTNRSAAPAAIDDELEAARLDVDELLATSDVVSLHCPYTPETHHLIGPDQLRAMRRTAFLINTSRGPVVDEAALVAALEAGRIAGAGLDVFEHEPEVHPGLLGRDDVVLVPHLGSATVETRSAMAELAARNAVAVLAGQPPITPVGA
ncbi:MAG: 2-hydroxyacid dehydrogenase [Ilumatobacteraceae bacterium]